MSLPTRKILRWVKILVTMFVFATACVLVKVYVFGHRNVLGFAPPPLSYKIGDEVQYNYRQRLMKFEEEVREKKLEIDITDDYFATVPTLDSCETVLGVPAKAKRDLRSFQIHPYINTVCLQWKGKAKLILQQSRVKGSNCYAVNWTADSLDDTLENCIKLDGAHWYGGALLSQDQWPLKDASIPMQPFTSSPLGAFTRNPSGETYGPVLEQMWLNSAGFAVFVDSAVPLHVSINAGGDTRLCLRARYGNSRYKPGSGPLSLNYSVCMDRTTKQVQGHMLKTFITIPKYPPREKLLQDPVWSTRGINMHNLTQSQALGLQVDILNHKLPHSQFHISGNCTRFAGSMYLDWSRFPNAHQMISEMTGVGFDVSTTIFPFVEMGPDPFEEGKKAGVFIATQNSQVAGVPWDNRTVALVDFTNLNAWEWMKRRMEAFRKESGARAFHFHGGEAILLSGARETTVPLLNPTDYSTHFAKFASTVSDSVIIAVGYRSQEFGLMVDIGARVSNWGYNLGLKSIIPSVLTLGLMGYPFLLVGPVGGVSEMFNVSSNAYVLPDRELYIRWLQLSVFLPAFEISVGPWQYDEMVSTVAHELLKLRLDYISPLIHAATKEFLRTGAPIVRPLWWMAADDETAQRIDCEFLVSNRLLVAPILDHGARQRSIYLPKVSTMKWRDKLHNKVYTGGQWLHNFVVELSEIAYFVAE